MVILSFRVSRVRDLRRPVVDSVADGMLAAVEGCRESGPQRRVGGPLAGRDGAGAAFCSAAAADLTADVGLV